MGINEEDRLDYIHSSSKLDIGIVTTFYDRVHVFFVERSESLLVLLESQQKL